MPTIDQSKIISLMQKYNKQITAAQRLDEYQKMCAIYEQILSLDPFSAKIYSRYSSLLRKLKEYQKGCLMIQQAIQIQPANFSLYKQYLDLLFEIENFEEIKKIIRRAQKLKDDDTSLCVKYARACHRSQTFKQGLQMIDSYEAKYPQNVRKNQRILLWRVYLYYQVGDYKKAYFYSKVILDSQQFQCQDKEYYQIQICKYCILLEQYKEGLSWAQKLITSSKTDSKTLLKTYALKSYSLIKQGLNVQAEQAMESALKLNKNDQMTQCKSSLFKIISIAPQQIDNLNKWKVKQRLQYVLGKMKQSNEKTFDCDKFSEHFNYYKQMQEFVNNLNFIYQHFELLPTNLAVFKQISNNLIMSLLEGYENCLKTYDKLKMSRQVIKEKQLLNKNSVQSDIKK